MRTFRQPAAAIDPTRFVRHRKYLFPLKRGKFGAPAPNQMASIDQLCERYPDKVFQTHLQSTEPQQPELFKFHIVDNGDTSEFETHCFFQSAGAVTSFLEGSSVDRTCCLVGPNNTSVEETAFNLSTRQLIKSLKLGVFNPYIRRYRRQGDLCARRSLPLPMRLSGTVASLNCLSAHNYFHWMVEVVPRIAGIEMAGIECDYYLIDCLSGFQRQVLALLGIPDEKLIQPHCHLNVECDRLLHVTQGNSAMHTHFKKMIDRNVDADPNAQRQIYISRKKAINRKIVNEPELEEILAARGFEIVCFEDLTVAQQFKIAGEARTIVTAHGAALANTMFARPGTNIVEMYPRQRGNITLYPALSHSRGLRHFTVLGDYTPLWKNIRVDWKNVSIALDLIDSQAVPSRSAA